MKQFIYSGLAVVLSLSACGNSDHPETKQKADTLHAAAKAETYDKKRDLAEIQSLIRKTLAWAETQKAAGDEIVKDSICIGFDMKKHSLYLEQLKRTDLFADEFLHNYDRIIRTIDKKIRNKEYKPWNVYELPTFRFANDASPWCDCQDNMAWDAVIVKPINLEAGKGELTWHWGGIEEQTDPSWKEFSYRFRVIKVDGKWKIAYLQGFDYEQAIKADGEV